MTTALASPSAAVTPIPFARLLKAGLLGGAVAAVANVVVYVIAHAAGQTLTAQFQPGTVSALGVAPVIISSVVPSLLGAGLLYALARFVKPGVTVFAAIAAVFTVVSFGGPASLGDASTGTVVTLDVMHLIAGAAITTSLVRSARRA